MPNGQQDGTLVTGSEEIEKARELHGDYNDSLSEYKSWMKGQEQKIMLWKAIRSVILEAETGNASMNTKDVLSALGVQDATFSDLSMEQKALLYTDIGQLGGGNQDRQIPEAESLLKHFEDTTVITDAAPFFYFGWKLALRKLLVEYHAQRLRLYLFKGELDEETYGQMTWSDFKSHAKSVKSGDGKLRLREIFDSPLDELNNHSDLLSNLQHDSEFFEAVDGMPYFLQLEVLLRITMGLSSSFVGERLLADLAWGYYGYTPQNGSPKRFKLADFFKPKSQLQDSIVNWGQRTGVDSYLGLNQESMMAIHLAIQAAPGYHLAAAMARDRSDISNQGGPGLEDIETEAALVLKSFTKKTQSAKTDLPFKAENNNTHPSHAREFLDFANGLIDDKFTTISDLILDDWAQVAGLQSPGSVPDKKLIDKFEAGVDAHEASNAKFSKSVAEGAIALRRILTAYNAAANAYGTVLFFTAAERNTNFQQDLEDLKMGLDLVTNTSDFYRSVFQTEIEWEKVQVEGSTDGSLRPVREVKEAGDIEKRLSTVSSRVKNGLLSDLDKTAKNLDRLEATIDAIEARVQKSGNPFDPTGRQAASYKRGVEQARKQIRRSRASIKQFRTHLQANDLDKAAAMIADENLDELLKATDNAVIEVDWLVDELARNAPLPESRAKSILLSTSGISGPFKVNGRAMYTDVADIKYSSSALTDVSDAAYTKLDDLAGLDLATEEMAEALTDEGLERRLQRARKFQQWFSLNGSAEDLLYAKRTTGMIEEGGTVVAYEPKWGKFGVRLGLNALGVVADLMDMWINGLEGWTAWEKGDYSATAGFALQVVGTGLMFLSGPVGWIGVGMVVAGIGLTVFTSDSEVTVWIRHTYFGRYWQGASDKSWSHEFYRWGMWLDNLLSKELPEGGSDSDPGLRSQLELYTEQSNDPDMKKYFASQLSWFYKHRNEFDVSAAELSTDSEGFPTLQFDLKDPGSGRNNTETFRYGSVILIRPVVFKMDEAADDLYSVRLDAGAFPITDSLPTRHSVALTMADEEDSPSPPWFGRDSEFTQKFVRKLSPVKRYDWSAGPYPLSMNPSQGYLQYDATLDLIGWNTYQQTTDHEDVWIDKVSIEISLNDSFQKKYKDVFKSSSSDPTFQPLNYLFGYTNVDTDKEPISPNLAERFNYPDQSTADKFELPSGNYLFNKLGVEVYHLPPGLVKTAKNWQRGKDDSYEEMLRQVEVNPFAARAAAIVDADGYSTQPPPWKENL